MDDLLGKKKDVAPIVDFSKTAPTTKEDFKKMLDRIPDFKIKAEKVYSETIKIKDKKLKFKSKKHDVKALKESYSFLDPLPIEMRKLKIVDLAAVEIDWRMLTTLRPKIKVEENYFSRLVELVKLDNKTRAFEKKQFAMDPQIRKSKTKSGILERRVVSCLECGEDFCNGKMCTKFNYDSFARAPDVPVMTQKVLSQDSTKGETYKKKIKRRSRMKNKTKNKGSKLKSQKKNMKN